MTDYNDGKWHGWNGGECPVHPETEVEVVSWAGSKRRYGAGFMNWSDEAAQSHVVAFRVTKEHREPKTAWIDKYGTAWNSFEAAKEFGCYPFTEYREVIE